MKIQDKLKELWAAMCKHDGFDPDNKSVVFSQDNPYQGEYNRTLRLYMAAKKVGAV